MLVDRGHDRISAIEVADYEFPDPEPDLGGEI